MAANKRRRVSSDFDTRISGSRKRQRVQPPQPWPRWPAGCRAWRERYFVALPIPDRRRHKTRARAYARGGLHPFRTVAARNLSAGGRAARETGWCAARQHVCDARRSVEHCEARRSMKRNDCPIRGEDFVCNIRTDVCLVMITPASRNRGIQNDGQDYLRPSSRHARISSTVTRGACFRISLISAIARRASSLSAIRIRHQPGDWLAMARDHDSLATLDLVEEFGKMGLGGCRLNLLHILTGQFGPVKIVAIRFLSRPGKRA